MLEFGHSNMAQYYSRFCKIIVPKWWS